MRRPNFTVDRLWELLGIQDPGPLRIADDIALQFSLGTLADHMPPLMGVRAYSNDLIFVLAGFGWSQLISEAPGGILITKFRQNIVPTTANGASQISLHATQFTAGITASTQADNIPTGRGTPVSRHLIEVGGTNPITGALALAALPDELHVDLGWYLPRGQALIIANNAPVIKFSGFEWLEFGAAPQQEAA